MGKKFRHLTYEQRKQIETMRNEGIGVQTIANMLGITRGTVYNELKRGDKDGKYVAEISHARYEKMRLKKGREPIITRNKKLQKFICDKILTEEKSPKQIEMELRQLRDTRLGTVGYETIYTAIKKGYVPGVTMETLQQNVATVQRDKSIYIPKWFVEKYGLTRGQQFELSMEEDKIVLKMLND